MIRPVGDDAKAAAAAAFYILIFLVPRVKY